MRRGSDDTVSALATASPGPAPIRIRVDVTVADDSISPSAEPRRTHFLPCDDRRDRLVGALPGRYPGPVAIGFAGRRRLTRGPGLTGTHARGRSLDCAGSRRLTRGRDPDVHHTRFGDRISRAGHRMVSRGDRGTDGARPERHTLRRRPSPTGR